MASVPQPVPIQVAPEQGDTTPSAPTKAAPAPNAWIPTLPGNTVPAVSAPRASSVSTTPLPSAPVSDVAESAPFAAAPEAAPIPMPEASERPPAPTAHRDLVQQPDSNSSPVLERDASPRTAAAPSEPAAAPATPTSANARVESLVTPVVLAEPRLPVAPSGVDRAVPVPDVTNVATPPATPAQTAAPAAAATEAPSAAVPTPAPLSMPAPAGVPPTPEPNEAPAPALVQSPSNPVPSEPSDDLVGPAQSPVDVRPSAVRLEEPQRPGAQPINPEAIPSDPSQMVAPAPSVKPVASPAGFAPWPVGDTRPEASPVESVETPAETPLPAPVAGPAVAPTLGRAPAPALVAMPSIAPEQLVEQVVRAVRVDIAGERSEMLVRLDPPELGRLQVRLLSEAGAITAAIHVESESVRKIIEAHLPTLRSAFDQAGVTVQQFTVTTGPDVGMFASLASSDQSGQFSAEEQASRRQPSAPPRDAGHVAGLDTAADLSTARTNGRLDYFA